jgi:hypothetical protein
MSTTLCGSQFAWLSLTQLRQDTNVHGDQYARTSYTHTYQRSMWKRLRSPHAISCEAHLLSHPGIIWTYGHQIEQILWFMILLDLSDTCIRNSFYWTNGEYLLFLIFLFLSVSNFGTHFTFLKNTITTYIKLEHSNLNTKIPVHFEYIKKANLIVLLIPLYVLMGKWINPGENTF